MSVSFHSEVGALRRVVLKHARDAFGGPDEIESQWRALGYLGPPHYARSLSEFDAFVDLLRSLGIDLEMLPPSEGVGLDSLYTRDAAVATDAGIILGCMGKAARSGEPDAHEAAFLEWGIPVVGRVEGDGLLEGGDVVWLDQRTLAVGVGYRTNAEGIRQLSDLVPTGVDVISVTLPHWVGPEGVFHLMSMMSPLDTDLALVHSPLLPVPFRQLLVSRGVGLLEVHESEFDALGCNALAVAPRVCVLAAGAPRTVSRLTAAGVEVHEFEAEEICLKGSGGPTCLTRPLERTV